MIPAARASVALFLAVSISAVPACTDPGADDAPTVRIAFFQDLSVPDHVDLVSPSFLAFDMLLARRLDDEAVVAEVMQLDTAGDGATAIEMAETVAADPSFVLAVAAPFWHEPSEVASILADAGIPTVSLSAVSGSPWAGASPPPGSAEELWKRFVPDRGLEAELLASIAARRSAEGVEQPVCIVRDGSPYGDGLADQVEAGLLDWPTAAVDGSDPVGAARRIAETGCPVVVWAGFPPGARELARAMRATGSARGRPVDLAGDALKTTIPPTSPVGDGVVVGSVACSCVDVSTALGLSARRFVNAYQSDHGLTPGVYAAEAWDAGRVVVDALLDGAVDRASMRARIAELDELVGVARTYRFDAAGELVGADPGLYVAAGTRWLPLPA